MGGHHLHFTASRSITGGTTIYSSLSPHRGYKWDGASPMDGCPGFPIDDMAITGHYEMSKEELRAYVAAKDPDYVAVEVYCNYDGGLDMFLRTGDYGRWRLYKLRMPLEHRPQRRSARLLEVVEEDHRAVGQRLLHHQLLVRRRRWRSRLVSRRSNQRLCWPGPKHSRPCAGAHGARALEEDERERQRAGGDGPGAAALTETSREHGSR